MEFSSYKKSEEPEITQLFDKVFSESEGTSEGTLVSSLVIDLIDTTNEQDIFGFVARDDKRIIGSIFFSRLSFSNLVQAFILSPVAVDTNYQGQGIGQRLINFGIEQLKDNGVQLLFTYGDPEFYSKVGFQCISEDVIKAPLELSQPEGWLCQSLVGDEITPIAERPRCVAALNKPELW